MIRFLGYFWWFFRTFSKNIVWKLFFNIWKYFTKSLGNNLTFIKCSNLVHFCCKMENESSLFSNWWSEIENSDGNIVESSLDWSSSDWKSNLIKSRQLWMSFRKVEIFLVLNILIPRYIYQGTFFCCCGFNYLHIHLYQSLFSQTPSVLT